MLELLKEFLSMKLKLFCVSFIFIFYLSFIVIVICSFCSYSLIIIVVINKLIRSFNCRNDETNETIG